MTQNPHPLLNSIQHTYARLLDRVQSFVRSESTLEAGDVRQVEILILDVTRLLDYARQNMHVFPDGEFALLDMALVEMIGALEDKLRTSSNLRDIQAMNAGASDKVAQSNPPKDTPMMRSASIASTPASNRTFPSSTPTAMPPVSHSSTHPSTSSLAAPTRAPTAVQRTNSYLASQRSAASPYPVSGRSGPEVHNIKQNQIRVARAKGPNALWSLGTYTDLQKYGIVLHVFVDECSNFITGMRVHDNKNAISVLRLFLDATNAMVSTVQGDLAYGIPSRVRGDESEETTLVANWMEGYRGTNRFSYFTGRLSDHSLTQHVWRNVKEGLCRKWEDFFFELEELHGLKIDCIHHIWLLHHLFLKAIGEEADSWRTNWNRMVIQTPSPNLHCRRDMFFSLSRQGPEGPYFTREPMDEPLIHLVKSEAVRQSNNTSGQQEGYLSTSTVPEDQNHDMLLQPPACPLEPEELRLFEEELAARSNTKTSNISDREEVWREGLDILEEILGYNEEHNG